MIGKRYKFTKDIWLYAGDHHRKTTASLRTSCTKRVKRISMKTITFKRNLDLAQRRVSLRGYWLLPWPAETPEVSVRQIMFTVRRVLPEKLT
jgi:hypothetical protein